MVYCIRKWFISLIYGLLHHKWGIALEMVHKPDTSAVFLSGLPVFCMFSSLMCMLQGNGGGGREVWHQQTMGVCTTPSGLPLTVSRASISRLRVTESAVTSPIYPFSHKHTAHTLLYTGNGLTYTCLRTNCMYVLALNNNNNITN